MLRRAFVLLLGTLALAGCAGGTAVRQPGFVTGVGALGTGAPAGHRVAILLPVTGPNAVLGQALLNAAHVALDVPGAPPLDPLDTGGTPAGAANAARQAIAAGAGLILGPLTGPETAAVAPIARATGVAVLAFTSDPAQAQPGVYTLGITPDQQVRRLAMAAQAQGHGQLAGLLPETEFGRAMADALNRVAPTLGLAPPTVRSYGGSFGSINMAARDLSGYANRRGPIDAQIHEARARGDAEGRKQAAELARSAIPPAPFDALLIAETGEKLSEVLSLLPYYDIDPPHVLILGPALWATDVAGVAGERGIGGALFAAPDPQGRAAFEQGYTAKYGAPPPRIADIAFDAAGIARVVGQGGGFAAASLLRQDGFNGADGHLALQPDGSVHRDLAIFQIGGGGAPMIDPNAAPASPPPGAPGTPGT